MNDSCNSAKDLKVVFKVEQAFMLFPRDDGLLTSIVWHVYLQAVDSGSELVCIHDSARPLISRGDIEKV